MSRTIPQSAGQPGTPSGAERRKSARFPARPREVFWRLLGSKDAEPLCAELLDVSSRGIGLLLSSSVRLGSVLGIQLYRDAPQGGVLVRVKHIATMAHGEYKVGATFVTPLTDEQLDTLAFVVKSDSPARRAR